MAEPRAEDCARHRGRAVTTKIPPFPILLIFLLLAGGCGPRHEPLVGEVKQKLARPAGDAVGVITLAEGGATVSDAYHVYLENPANPDQTSEVLRYDKGMPPTIFWNGDGSLKIRVDCGQIYNFTNFVFFWPSGKPDHFERIGIFLETRGVCPYSR